MIGGTGMITFFLLLLFVIASYCQTDGGTGGVIFVIVLILVVGAVVGYMEYLKDRKKNRGY